jgi:hypothetical protein
MGTPQSGRRGEHLSTPRIVYFGSGAFAVPPLERLHAAGYPILAVVSQPPKPAGRGMRLQPTPVHRLAESLGLPVLTPARARDPEFLAQLRALAPDLIVLASYGKILPQAALEIAPLGNWNLHGSLLPKYRGASPIQYALLNGERKTGVTLMEMVAEMDAGDIYLQAVEPIHPDDDYGTLEARLAQRGGEPAAGRAGALASRHAYPHAPRPCGSDLRAHDYQRRHANPLGGACRTVSQPYLRVLAQAWRIHALAGQDAQTLESGSRAAHRRRRAWNDYRLCARRFSRRLRGGRAAPAGGAARKPPAHGDPRVPEWLPPQVGERLG